MENQRRSIFDCVEEKARALLNNGLSIRKVYFIVKDEVPVKTGYTGFYNFVVRKGLKTT